MPWIDYEKISASHSSLKRGRVWCRTCRAEQEVNSADCLRNGWPKCCGATMTIDHPDTWNDDRALKGAKP